MLIRTRSYPAWFDKEVLHLKKKKNTAWRKAKKNNTSTAWSKFKKTHNKLISTIRKKHCQFISEFGTTVKENPKRFWGFVKSKTKQRSIPKQIKYKDIFSFSAEGKANLFNDYFASVFGPSEAAIGDQTVNCDVIDMSIDCLSDITICVNDVYQVLSKLDTSKAVGPDKLSPLVLKTCSSVLSESLCKLINRSLVEGRVPNDWLNANVIPVHKCNDKQNVENYRPISLLSIVSKVAERCIYNKIFPKIEPILHGTQHGFLHGKSTTTQLLHFLADLSSTCEASCQTDVIYTDFSKAFDKVSHRLLLLKLRKVGICGKLHSWFKSYLLGRHQCVVLDGAVSQSTKVTSGVPQGSILGPLMFLIYINDLPDVLQHCSPLLFADDTKIYCKINSITDCMLIQEDINLLYSWCCKWKLDFNVNKCKVLSVTKSRSPTVFNYNINGKPIERVDSFKDLGIIIQSDLSWNSHINTIISKANRMSGLIKRTVGYQAPVNVKHQLYVSLVRSNLEYGTQVWNGLTKTNRVKLERVQRATTRYILNFPSSSYSNRMSELNMLPLTLRRDMLDVKFFFKCLQDLNSLNVTDYVIFSCNSQVHTRNSCDPNLIKPPYCRTTTFRNSYFNRISYTWNEIPLSIRTLSNVNSLSSHLKKHFVSMASKFNPECCCCLYVKCNCLHGRQT